jgi:hypothetical protein
VKLPNGDRAVVGPEKVRDYLLSSSHPTGRFKAAVFSSTGVSAEDFEKWLLLTARSGEATAVARTPYGEKFEIRATLAGRNGRTLEVITAWIVRTEEDFPRLITAYPA